jgi:hypothetical protein
VAVAVEDLGASRERAFLRPEKDVAVAAGAVQVDRGRTQ